MSKIHSLHRLQRRLERAQAQLLQCEAKYNGKEDEHTFHGGQELGYAQALVSVLEDWVDHIIELNREFEQSYKHQTQEQPS